MNTNTGEIYRDPWHLEEAMKRDEPVAEVSAEVADAVEVGMALNRAMRRAIEHNREYQPEGDLAERLARLEDQARRY